MDRAGFDPRYSPEFQRGFDPATQDPPADADSRIRPVPEPITPVPQPIVRRVPPAEGRAAAEPLPTAWADDMFGPVDATGAEHPSDESEHPAVPASPWRNPYLIALTIVGVVLVAGGIGAFRWSVRQVFGGASYGSGATQAEMEENILAAQLAWGLSPLLAMAGLLTLLGVFFFAAWRWRPQRRSLGDGADFAPDVNQAD